MTDVLLRRQPHDGGGRDATLLAAARVQDHNMGQILPLSPNKEAALPTP